MVYVGLDISINSPAICIEHNDKLYYFGYYREGKKQTKKEKRQVDFLNNLEFCTIKSLPEKLGDSRYSSQEYIDLMDGVYCMNDIVSTILKFKGDEIRVGIEGFSYGSNGSSLSKLYGYQYLLRYFLIKYDIQWDIFSPKTVKKSAGHGNFKKENMIENFLNNSKNINILENNKFRKTINNNLEIIKPINKYLKPFEDICDAFWVRQTLKENINKQKTKN